MKDKSKISPAVWFVLKFLSLFGLFYGFYIFFLALTSQGGLYSPFLGKHLNAISGLRYILIESSATILRLLGYQTRTNTYQLLVVGHNILHIGYDCLGFAVMCFFTAFVIAYSGSLRSKLYFWGLGLITIQLLNITRFILLAIYWKRNHNVYLSDHHTIFNIIVYLIIAISLYFYTKHQTSPVSNR